MGPVEQARLWKPEQLVETHADGAREILNEVEGLGEEGKEG